MGRTITLQLPNALYAAIQQAAQTEHQTMEAWILARLPDLVTGATVGNVGNAAAETPDDAEDDPESEFEPADLDLALFMQEAATAARYRPAPTEDPVASVTAILANLAGAPLSEADAIELAMSRELDEQNLDDETSAAHDD
jgi:hypothetical protein